MKDSVLGHSDSTVQVLLKSILNLYCSVDDEVTRIKKQIDSIINEYNNHIVSIPRITKYSAPQIIDEVGVFTRFSSSAKLLAFAGIELSTIRLRWILTVRWLTWFRTYKICPNERRYDK